MTTANMGLTLPNVSVTPGPTWASQINSDLTLIDQHNHIPGANGGVPITSAALQVDADVEFNTVFPAGAAAKGLSYLGLLAPIGTANVPTRIRSDDVGDLYYDNASNVPVRLTNGASVAGTQGSISNLISPASANYNFGTGTFEWTSSANTGAGMDSGPVTIRDGTSGSQGVTLTPAPGLVSAYILTLPPSAPASQRLLTANAGVSAFAAIDGTLSLTSSLLKVANGGIKALQLDTDAVETAKIKDQAVTQQKTQIKPVQASANVPSSATSSTSPVSATGLSCLFVALANRPICVELTPWEDGTVGSIYSSTSYADVSIYATAPGGSSLPIATVRAPTAVGVQLSTLRQVIVSPIAGLYSFQVKFNTGGSGTVTIGHARLIAYPL